MAGILVDQFQLFPTPMFRFIRDLSQRVSRMILFFCHAYKYGVPRQTLYMIAIMNTIYVWSANIAICQVHENTWFGVKLNSFGEYVCYSYANIWHTYVKIGLKFLSAPWVHQLNTKEM